jgi:hypothetical protein
MTLPSAQTGTRLSRRPTVLALDVDGTLMDGVVRRNPRPGLLEFFNRVRPLFPRIVIYSHADPPLNAAALEYFADGGLIPAWAAALEFVATPPAVWEKDLRLIPGCALGDAVIVDDIASVIVFEQMTWWVPITEYDPKDPDAPEDAELARVADVLEYLCTGLIHAVWRDEGRA